MARTVISIMRAAALAAWVGAGIAYVTTPVLYAGDDDETKCAEVCSGCTGSCKYCAKIGTAYCYDPKTPDPQ